MENIKNYEDLVKKVEAMKKSGTVDLSTEEDLSIAIMNLISLEEHFFFTASKTGKDEYFDLLGQVREVRKTLLARLIDKNEGETWCISKHLLATTMRLMEVGTKLHSDGKDKEAKETFQYAYQIYTLFWAVRLKLVNVSDLKEKADADKPWDLKDIVDKMVNCCDE
jgi:hypothetical protein